MKKTKNQIRVEARVFLSEIWNCQNERCYKVWGSPPFAGFPKSHILDLDVVLSSICWATGLDMASRCTRLLVSFELSCTMVHYRKYVDSWSTILVTKWSLFSIYDYFLRKTVSKNRTSNPEGHIFMTKLVFTNRLTWPHQIYVTKPTWKIYEQMKWS